MKIFRRQLNNTISIAQKQGTDASLSNKWETWRDRFMMYVPKWRSEETSHPYWANWSFEKAFLGHAQHAPPVSVKHAWGSTFANYKNYCLS